ncbi:hypothetical protein BpHYR1_017735 [Brachionus plicatilis]|uniref:Uncharacterized protein n=1 Tax=Brachionus plicatilis TaxID=10195 RepID=A0A3M7S6A3_BRAPC|nr:hypothetical protein BpHYR1_017735 [Brachionus plicatilis]
MFLFNANCGDKYRNNSDVKKIFKSSFNIATLDIWLVVQRLNSKALYGIESSVDNYGMILHSPRKNVKFLVKKFAIFNNIQPKNFLGKISYFLIFKTILERPFAGQLLAQYALSVTLGSFELNSLCVFKNPIVSLSTENFRFYQLRHSDLIPMDKLKYDFLTKKRVLKLNHCLAFVVKKIKRKVLIMNTGICCKSLELSVPSFYTRSLFDILINQAQNLLSIKTFSNYDEFNLIVEANVHVKTRHFLYLSVGEKF